jgi:hypothetical protein
MIFMAAPAALVASLSPPGELNLHGRLVHVGDVARVRGRGAQDIKSLVIARLPEGTRKTVTREELGDLIIRAVPAARIEGADDKGITLIAPAAGLPSPAHCFEALQPIAQEQAITIENVRVVPCSARTAAAVVRDLIRGTTTAAAAIQTGDYLGQILLSEPARIERGDTLTLVSKSGPVTITREVKALQPARARQQRLFVQSSDGAVFSARLAAGGAK